jgi:hypothetical protein
MRRLWLVPTLLGAALATTAAQQDINARIRDEVNERSQVMRSIHYLTDVHGPRVTGSPSLKAAGEWAVHTMGSWGLTGGRMEPWEFGHAGWANERFTAHILSPVKDQLTAEVLAWTPGLPSGTVRAQAFHLIPPDRTTPEQLTAYLEGRGQRVLDALDEVASETGAALASITLAWTMAQPAITAPIASATSLKQLDELLAALTLELTPGQIARLDEASA